MSAQKRTAAEKACLREYLKGHKQNMGRNMNGKIILKTSQAEIRSMLLETEGKVILVKKQQRAWLDCVCL